MTSDFKTTMKAIRRGWFFPLIGLLAALGVAAALHRNLPERYTSEATYLVVPVPEDPDILENIRALEGTRIRTILTTLTEIMTSDTVKSEATTAAGITASVADTIDVSASALPEAAGVVLAVSAGDPDTAATMAGAVADAASVRFLDVYRVYAVGALDPPTTPISPSSPGLFQLGLLAGGVGFLLGIAVALMRGPGDTGRKQRKRKKSVSNRLDVYASNVTPLHDRYQRTG